jgi:hypothetical protein
MLAGAACSSGNPSGPGIGTSVPVGPTSISVAPTSTLSVADEARQSALVSYRGMWQDFVAAGITSDWQSLKLGRYARGIALTNMSRSLYADHYNGLVTRGEPSFAPSVASVAPPDNPNKVVITDCSDGTHWLKYKAANGQLVNDTPGGRHLINAIIEKQSDGSWKVSEYGVHESGTC